jgi:pyrroloquinoline quinone (PQQ) biosynthesis protein C
MFDNVEIWLAKHPVFSALQGKTEDGAVLSAYAEGFAPVVNAVPVFLHVTLSRADAEACGLLRDIWNDELGVSGTAAAHPVLFDEVHRAFTSRWGPNLEAQRHGIKAAKAMIDLCSSGPWPIGVAAMRAHESQFPTAYSEVLDYLHREIGPAAEFFSVHSLADVEHSAVGRRLLERAVYERIATENEIVHTFDASTTILRNLMDSIWRCAHARN